MMRLFLDSIKWFVYFVVFTSCILYGVKSWTQYVDHLETQKEQHVHQVLEPPFVHHGDKRPDNKVRPGSVIYVHNVYTRSERCSMQVATLLVGVDSDRVVHWNAFVNWLDRGSFVTDEALTVPDWIPAGKYRIVKRTAANCNDRTVFFINFDLPVEISP